MLEMNLQYFAETLPENTITPEINYETEAFINTAPDEAAPVWASLSALTKNMAESLNEVLYQANYYKPSDPAYEYLTKKEVMYGFGAARKTHLKLTRGNQVITWPVTLANITKGRGDASATNTLTVTIHGNGAPTMSVIEA